MKSRKARDTQRPVRVLPVAARAMVAAFGLASLAVLAAPTQPGTPAVVRRLVLLKGEPLADLHLRKASPGSIHAARAVLREDQQRLAHAIGTLGGRVLQTWELLNHGAWVELPAAHAESLPGLMGVARVFEEGHLAPATSTSVPYVRAPVAWSSPASHTGRGLRIGIIDSGIDYLHADFGGPGSAAAHASNDPAFVEPGSFPTAVVTGGTDLVGDDYDSSSSSTSNPRPDPDPLDPAANGHGTHVAGIAAGRGVLADGSAFSGPYDANAPTNRWRIGPGMAPEATLHAIKVFGRGGLTSTAIVVQALELAADPNRDGNPSDHLDVANLSLGSAFGINDPEEPQAAAIQRLTALGCVVVLSAGNGGNTAFKVDSPASAAAAIAVANAYDDGFTTSAISIDAPADLAAMLGAVEGQFTPPLATLPPVSGRLVRVVPSLACDPIQNAPEIRGNIAMVDRGTCFFLDKIRSLQAVGARAVVVVNNVDGPPIVMGASGDASDIAIPAVMISRADGDRIKARLPAQVVVTLGDDVRIGSPELADSMNESSSRGPVWPVARLKPDLAAPGSSIESAAAGTGSFSEPMTGTSMAAPHVAGAAALVRHARPTWPARDIKAALMNTAASPLRNVAGHPQPESWVGAGRLDVSNALQTPLVARSASDPDAVSLSFGRILADQPLSRTQAVAVVNHGPTTQVLRPESLNTLDQPGARLVPLSESVAVPPHGSAEFNVRLEIDPARLLANADRASAPLALGRARQGIPEASGQLWLRGGPVDIHVPWHAMVRAVGRPAANTTLAGVAPVDPATVPLPTTPTASPGDGGWAAVFQRGFLNTTPSASGEGLGTDIVAVGATSDFPARGSLATTTVSFAVVMAGAWATPSRAFMRIDIDIDRDGNGTPDAVLSNGDTGLVQSDDLDDEQASTDAHVSVAKAGSGALAVAADWNRLEPSTADPAAFGNGVVVLSASGASLGLINPNAALRYRVRTGGWFSDSTPWILFHAARPLMDGTSDARPGGLWQREGGSVSAVVRRGNAAVNGASASGRVHALLVHLHAMPGAQAESVTLDLAQPDTDGDGLPDAWELAMLGDLRPTMATDRDRDGFPDGVEWQRGMDPVHPDGFVRAVPARDGVVLEWTGTPGRTFSIQRADSIAGPFVDWKPVVAASHGMQSIADADPAGTSAQRYYRLSVLP